MRNQTIIHVLSMLLLFGNLAVAQPDSAVDWKKAQNSHYLQFLEHLNIPTTSVLHSKAIDKSAARKEIADLKTVARTLFKPSLGLSDTAIEQNVIAVPNFRDGSDFLILKQNTEIGRVVVQDGKSVNVLVDPNDATTASLEKEPLQNHVISVARSVFNIPGAEQSEENFTFLVSSVDLGDSKAGAIYYGMGSSEDWSYRHWYSTIHWWSDGRRVMFQIGKFGILNPKVDPSKFARPPKDYAEPRKFGRAE